MSYTPTEWEPTDVVTATRMNALETAVGDINMSYTPNVWSDGDILSAEKMNALEQAVASGGGGSSDFSTAEVTVINETSDIISLSMICIKNGDLDMGITVDQKGLIEPTVETAEVVLYQGNSFAGFMETGGGSPIENYSLSGNIVDEDGLLIVTGDGTITIS